MIPKFLLSGIMSVVTAVILLFCQGPLSAETLAVNEVADRLQLTYESTASFTADFKQTTVLSFNQRQRQGNGLVTIEKGGRMRWEYEKPDPQVLVSDGKLFSMYVAKDRQMIVGDASTYLESDVTYAFLSGTGDISRDFIIEKPGGETPVDGAHHLRLTPKKEHPQVDYLEVWVNGSTFLIDRLKISDHFGSVTELVFSNMRINLPIPDNYFSFVPPEGTEIIEQ